MRALLVVLSLVTEYTWAEVVDDGGWYTEEGEEVGGDGPCNIERHSADTFTQQEFELRYAEKEPVILTGLRGNEEFRRLLRKEEMLQRWGHRVITLASANAYSYKKVDMKLSTYINDYVRPQNKYKRGNETFYLFGDIDREEWSDLLQHYERPRWKVPGHQSELSFGLAGAGTGVPFHIHGPTWAEVIYGRKRWFLTEPDARPDYDPDETTLLWFLNRYPKLPREKKPLECVLGPGEVHNLPDGFTLVQLPQIIYFPNMWWHATLNVETSVFISTFLSP